MRSGVSWPFVSYYGAARPRLNRRRSVCSMVAAGVADGFVCGMIVSVGFNVWEAVG